MDNDLREQIGATAFAFRGYNITNLGRSDELLAHRVYGPFVEQHLKQAGEICADVTHTEVNLLERVRQRQEPTLDTYHESIALIVAMELAQIQLMEEVLEVPYPQAKLAFGYSLGELAALACGGVFGMAEALTVPLSMARECAELSRNVTMGVFFSRGPALDLDQVQRLCLRINHEGKGVIGVSSILSPNTMLLLGQDATTGRFQELMTDFFKYKVYLRVNHERWPPLHTPIMWQCHIPNRAAVMMHTMPGGFVAPTPPMISLVTGKKSYADHNVRDILARWVDHPQRLWDAVYETLASGARTVVHVGPDANLIPATFKRLSDNVTAQVSGRSLGSLGMRAISGMARRQWLSTVLPSRAALLRAPSVRHVMLEDWLLEQPVG